jgi:hypothetical protein
MQLSYNKIIYRGVPSKFKTAPMTTSAMRKNEINFLEESFVDNFGDKLFDYYKVKVCVSSSIPFFKNVCDFSAWAWFLSLVHIVVEIQKRPFLIDALQYKSIITAFENLTKIEKYCLPQQIYDITRTIFEDNDEYDYFSKQASSNTNVSYMVYGLEYFQHLNFDLRGSLNYNPFPTMVMDWTEDIEIAKSFSCLDGKPGIILSINYDKYKQLLYDEWYPYLMSADIASNMPGFTPYFDYHFKFSKKNSNMQKQKGIVLFWPWSYTIDELATNEIGERLEFKETHIF